MNKTLKLIQTRDMIVPAILFKNYKKLNLNEEQLIVLIYLINNNNLEFNPKELCDILDKDLNDILKIINDLVNKAVLELKIKKIRDIHAEYISLDNLYKKLSMFIINENEEINSNKNIFDNFEKEFGRPLTPIEFELINSWLSTTNEELILLALKEAVYNGAISIRYIDRIIYDWSKKGLKTVEDVNKETKKFRNQVEVPEVFSYDWLNDDGTKDK